VSEPKTATGLEDVVAAVLGVDPAGLSDGDGPATIDRWSSRRHLELVVALENHYRVSFSNEEIFRMRSLGDLRETLRGKGVLR
jgi:acyl carrier protein